MLRVQLRSSVFLCLLLWQAAAFSEELHGTAVKVFDGDSFILKLAAGGEVEVRLGEIDALEKNQPYADTARTELRGMIFRKKLKLVVIDTDRYGRKVARASRVDDGLDINAELVRQGHAWVYRRHARDSSLYDLERRAREQRLGLWALPEAQTKAPWLWRQEHPPEKKSAPPPAIGNRMKSIRPGDQGLPASGASRPFE